MIDIYEKEEKLKWYVISEIEGRNIELEADYKISNGTLDQEQMYLDTSRSSTHSQPHRRYIVQVIQSKQNHIFSERRQDNDDNYVRSADSKAISEQWSKI